MNDVFLKNPRILQLMTAELNWTADVILKPSLYSLSTDHAQKPQFYCCIRKTTQRTSHVIPSQRLHWRCCLARRNNIRPLRHIFHCCTLTVFTEPLPRNALSNSVTILCRVLFYLLLHKEDGDRTLSSETSMKFYLTTRHNIPEDNTTHSHRQESLRVKQKTCNFLYTWMTISFSRKIPVAICR
jgi:hypothetical protein